MIRMECGPGINDLTEEQLIRFKMKKIASHIEGEYLGEEGIALAKMYETLANLNERRIIRVAALFYSCIGFCILIVKLLRGKR